MVALSNHRHTHGCLSTSEQSRPSITCFRPSCRKRRDVVVAAAAGQPEAHSNGHNHYSEDAFRIRAPSPQQLERSWQLAADGSSLADEFFSPYKAPEQHQTKVFVFVRHGHSTWNEQSRIQVSRVAAGELQQTLQPINMSVPVSERHTLDISFSSMPPCYRDKL